MQCRLVLGIFYIVCGQIHLVLRLLMPKVLILGMPKVFVSRLLVVAIPVTEILILGIVLLP